MMVATLREEDGRTPRCLFNGGPDENVEDLIEMFQHVLGARKMGHLVLWQESPLLESKPDVPSVVRAPKPPAGMAAFADSLGHKQAPISPSKTNSAGVALTPEPAVKKTTKHSKSHEKRVRKKAAAEAAAPAPTSPAVSPGSKELAAQRRSDERRMIEYTVRLTEYEQYLVDQKEFVLLSKDLEKRQKKWVTETREAVSMLFLRVGPLVKPVLRGVSDDLHLCFEKLRSEFHVVGKVSMLRKIIDFVRLKFTPGSTAEEWNMLFNERVRKFALPVCQGGVGETISVDTLSNAIFVMSLMAESSVEHFVTQSVTEGLEASLAETQRRFVNSRALCPGPIGTRPTAGQDPSTGQAIPKGVLEEKKNAPSSTEILFETNEAKEDSHDPTRCKNCNRRGHTLEMCYTKGGGRWKESHAYKRRSQEQVDERNPRRDEAKSKRSAIDSAVRREVAKLVKQGKIHDEASDSSQDRKPSRTRHRRSGAHRRKRHRCISGSDTSSTEEFNFMAQECSEDACLEYACAINESKTKKTVQEVPKYIDFHVDSACSSHMVPAKTHAMVSAKGVKTVNLQVNTAGEGGALQTTTRAEIPGAMETTRGTKLDATLKDSLGVKGLSTSLFSVMEAVEQGHTVKLQPKKKGGSYLQLQGREERIKIRVCGNAFVLRLQTEHGRRKQSKRKQKKLNRLLHRRCVHLNHKALAIMKLNPPRCVRTTFLTQ